LPWRRAELTPDEEVAPVVDAFREHHPRSGSDLIVRSYRRAAEAHEGQQRKSGDPYISHPLAVAKITADLGLDDTTIAAALLHDAVEDTRVALAEIEEEFGEEVAAIVDGVTKLERLEFESREAQQAATMRKMLVAMADDLRVLMVKLSDRLHNMRTLAAMPTEKQLRIAQETLDIYAPLAHRLGVQEVKQQLEDLAFAALHPKRFAEIDHLVDARAPERELYLTQVEGEITERLAEVRVKADVTGRPKHLWSIYEKMVRGRPFDDILDLVGLRVIVASVKDCYAALGCIHGMWQPVPGRFKDYIALPKFNLYQSLHTTVMGPGGKAVEVQIRTHEMHQRAELGVAAHWAYKEKSPADDIVWLNRILDWQTETTDPGQFMANLKGDLEDNEVYVFTPKGDVIILPEGATPLDFAYAIHTEVGHACIGARIDGRLVPLDSALKSGATIEVITSKVENPGPSRDWLNIVVTPRAQNRIRQWFSRERRGDAIEAGREDVIKTLRREGLPLGTDVLETAAEDLNYADVDALFAAVGEHHASAKSVATRVQRLLSGNDPEREEQLSTGLGTPRRPRRSASQPARVHVEGQEQMLVRLSRCCTPVPGDEIMGFITRGRGVTVHRTDCTNAVALVREQAERVIDVEWDADSRGSFVASLVVEALDREWLLRDVSAALSDHRLNILHSETRTGGDRMARMQFDVELGDPTQLDSLVVALKKIDCVFDAYRVLPGSSK
ncbi:MAG TPA: bifunctional (p)ppGpp synthetase/guanosine-3',5'-bis(diphosphate) 3'-pyrophosphohydrolase, partial [Acidimicrobiales bacterium]|nr:bifunctional (p)ppGpp synthetase/guanosine-3',5'-bis(diphosphate) 3'-pyrophosphohydrolase [Acidimicrobiales bacterium]